MTDQHLTVNEVAERLSCPRKSVESWIKSGELAAIDVACSGAVRSQWRIDEADLFDFCERRRNRVGYQSATPERDDTPQLLRIQ